MAKKISKPEELTNVELENMDNVEDVVQLIQAQEISKDIKKAFKSIEIDRTQMRYLVDLFYQTQDSRIEAQNRVRAIKQERDSAPDNATTAIMEWDLMNLMSREASLKSVIEKATQSCPIGKWLTSIYSIGPLLAGSCIAYFNIDKAKYATSFHQYAGLNDNNRPWLGSEKSRAIVNSIVGSSKQITNEHLEEVSAKTGWSVEYLTKSISYTKSGEKRSWTKDNLIKAVSMIPYNKRLKMICYKIGEQFVKISYNPKSLYGRLYKERKALEIKRNENGEYAEQAKRILESKSFSKSTDAYAAYSKGKLPKAHLDARAKRWTVKLFISHLFEEMYWEKYGEAPAPFYVLANSEMGNHTTVIEPEVPYTKSGPVNNDMNIEIEQEIIEEKKKKSKKKS